MNYLLTAVILLSFILTSCAGPETVARTEEFTVTGYDFSQYTEQGFLITPEQYLGEYQSIGLITVTQWPAVNEITRQVLNPNGPGYIDREEYVAEDINIERAIDEIYNVATDMGANAIARFDVTTTFRMNGTLRVNGIEISGFAIQRED